MHDDHRFDLNIFLFNKNTIGIEHNFHNFDRPLPQIYEEIIHKANIVFLLAFSYQRFLFIDLI